MFEVENKNELGMKSCLGLGIRGKRRVTIKPGRERPKR